MEWLKKLQAPKFYRYFFYRQYVFSKSVWDTEPAFSAMLMMSITIMFQVTFFSVILGTVLKIEILHFLFLDRGPLAILGFYLIFLILGYFLFYYNAKWSKIIKEFEGESEKKRLLGRYYLFISLLGLFWGLLWFIETTSVPK